MSFSVMIRTPAGVEKVDVECPGWVSQRTLEVPGWFTIREAAAIVRGALGLGPTGRLAELGTWKGRSAALLSDLLGAGWEVHTIDSYPAGEEIEALLGAKPEEALRAAEDELDGRGNVARWIAETDLSRVGGWGTPGDLGGPANAVAYRAASSARATWGRFPSVRNLAPFRVLFVDAEHSTDAILRDLETWEPLMAPRALVFLHDTTDPRCGDAVRFAAETFFGSRPTWTRRADLEVDSLWAFAR